ncbi:MAG: endonuclease [Bacilli bacterium]
MKNKAICLLCLSISLSILTGCKIKKNTSSNSEESTSIASSDISSSSSSSSSIESSSSISSIISSTQESSSTSVLEPVDISSYYDGYYNALSSWENGEDLKNQLKNIISQDVTYTPYSSTWSVLQKADQSQNNFDKVETVYSSLEQLKDDTYSSSNTSGWQKEHAFCQSLMGHYVNTTTTQVRLDETYKVNKVEIVNEGFVVTYANGMVSDDVYSLTFTYCSKNAVIYLADGMIYISESTDNKTPLSGSTPLFSMSIDNFTSLSARDNNLVLKNGEDEEILENPTYVTYRFKGEGGSGGTSSDWHNLFASNNSGNGSRGNKNLGVVTEPTYSSSDYIYDTKVFEPSDEDKGQLARGILYMDTMYEDLLIEEEYVELSKVLASDIGRHGNASSIINWASSFDVDEHEYQHNVAIYEIQHNRNPYIDFPALVDYVYGYKKDQPGNINDIVETSSQNTLNTNVSSYKNIAVEGVKYTYEVGDKYSYTDIEHIYTTYTDFSYQEISDRSQITFNIEDEFVFSQVGTFDISLSDGISHVDYQVEVIDKDPTQDCEVSYKAVVDGEFVDKTIFKGLTSSTPLSNVDLGGIKYNVSIAAGGVGTSNSSKGLAFGSNTTPVGTLTLETMEEIPQTIDKIYINTSMTNNKSATLSIYIGDNLVGNIVTSSTPTLYLFENTLGYTGKLKIEFTSANGTIYLMQIALKYK